MGVAAMTASAAVYIVGEAPFGGWNPAGGMEMTTTDDVTYTATHVEISGTVYFIFTTAQGDWTAVNAHRYSPTDANQQVAADAVVQTQLSTNDQAAYYITGDGFYDITFNINDLIRLLPARRLFFLCRRFFDQRLLPVFPDFPHLQFYRDRPRPRGHQDVDFGQRLWRQLRPEHWREDENQGPQRVHRHH